MDASLALGGAFTVAFVLLAWSSAWLKGRAWFGATIGSLAAALLSLEASPPLGKPGIEGWLELGGLALMFCGLTYVIAGRYITGTTVLDITYQSHQALVAYLNEKQDKSLVALIMRRAGPLLMLALIIYGLVIAWAKFTGAVK